MLFYTALDGRDPVDDLYKDVDPSRRFPLPLSAMAGQAVINAVALAQPTAIAPHATAPVNDVLTASHEALPPHVIAPRNEAFTASLETLSALATAHSHDAAEREKARIMYRTFVPDVSYFLTIVPHFRLYEVVSVIRRVIPYKYRKILGMLPNLLKLCELK